MKRTIRVDQWRVGQDYELDDSKWEILTVLHGQPPDVRQTGTVLVMLLRDIAKWNGE